MFATWRLFRESGGVGRKRIYLQEFIGLCNRLESLALSFAIRQKYGHEIFLDWHELDALGVDDTRRGAPGVFGRIGAFRLRECDDVVFAQLGRRNTIIQRTVYGPEAVTQPIYLSVARKIRLKKHLLAPIEEMFRAAQGRPVVGVHIRRGDFILSSPDVYDATATRHAAVPLWWYEFVMEAIARRQPDVCFFVSGTGDAADFDNWRRKFSILELNAKNPYAYKGDPHQSGTHPVADLFALACCPVILATPASSFSHWAANVLGAPSVAVLPPLKTTRDNPQIASLQMRGKLVQEWCRVCRETGAPLTAPDLSQVDLSRSADTGWIQTSD
jgi:hypothetical protein